MKKYSKLMAVLLVVAMLLPGIAQAAPVAEQAKVMRVAGETRVGTSIKVSEVAMDSATDAVLVGYNGEADALTGAIVAKAKNAPLFYVRTSEIEAVKARLDDLGVANVHVLGGTTVFTKELMKEFDAYNPVRIDGDNRYETAINAAKVAVGDKADTVFLAKGNETLADALSIGAISAKENTPLLLTHGKNLTEVTKEALKDMEVKNVEIIGGKAAVSEEIKEELEELGYKVNRTAGDNRQATSVEIAKKFNPNAKEIVIANGFDYADAVTAGYFAAGRDAVVLLTNQNVVHSTVKEFLEDNKLDTTVLGGPKAIAKVAFDKVVEYLDGVVVEMPEEDEEIELAVESVSAINAKTIEVTFNKAVVDTSKAEFELLRGTFKQNATVEWAEDNKSATLTVAGKLQDSKYTVNISGLTEEVLTETITVEAQKVASIEILDDIAVLSDKIGTPTNTATATVGYQVKDQYGDDITKTTTLETNDKTGITLDKSKGVVTISASLIQGKKVGDLIPVVLIDKDTGVTTTKSVKLSDASAVTTLEIESIYHKDGKELNEDSDGTEFFLVLNLQDQYGKEITDKNLAKNLIATSTNEKVVSIAKSGSDLKVDTKEIDGKERLVLSFDKKVAAGTSKVILISTTNGATTEFDVNVAETTRTDAVDLGQPEIAVKGEKVLLPLTVQDKEGNTITDLKLLKDPVKGIKLETGKEVVVKDGKTYVELTVTKEGYETVVVTTSTNKVATVTFEVKAEAKATAIRGLKKPLVVRAEDSKTLTKADFDIEDQYGRVMKTADVLDSIEVAATDANEKVVNVDAGSTVVHGLKNGKAKLVVSLANVDDSELEIEVQVTDGKEFVSYEIESFDYKVPVTGTAGVTTTATPFTVNGILEGGGKVALDTDDYSAEIVDSKGEKIDSAIVGKTIDLERTDLDRKDPNKDYDSDTNPKVDTEFTLKVLVEATGKTIEETFVASDKAAATSEFIFTEAKTDANVDTVKEFTKDHEVTGGTFNKDSLKNVLTTDQYGNKAISKASDTVGSLTIVPTDATKVTVKNQGTANANAVLVGSADEAELTVKVKIGNATKEVKVNLKKADKAEDVINASTGTYEGNVELTATGTAPVTYGPASGSRTIKGDVIITGDATNITLTSNLTITGDLIVTAPGATVNNSATVGGSIIVNDVKVNTWNQKSDHAGAIEFNAEGKTLNIKGNVGTVNVNKKATVTVETGVKVQNLAVNKAAKDTTVDVQANANVGSLKLDAVGSTVTIDKDAQVDDIQGEDEDSLSEAKEEQTKAAKITISHTSPTRNGNTYAAYVESHSGESELGAEYANFIDVPFNIDKTAKEINVTATSGDYTVELVPASFSTGLGAGDKVYHVSYRFGENASEHLDLFFENLQKQGGNVQIVTKDILGNEETVTSKIVNYPGQSVVGVEE